MTAAATELLAADSTAGAAAAAPEAPTAFRVQEKRYQLHREQHVRYRQGKARGAKYVTRPTDLSDVVDLHANASHPAAVAVTWPTAPCQHCQQEQKRQQGEQEQQWQQQQPRQQQEHLLCTCRTLTFPAHPGLLYLPTAIPTSLQLHLISEALEQYPEPPARTNHWRALGPLPGVFAAARQGLRCAVAPVPLEGGGSGMYASGDRAADAHGAAAAAAAAAAGAVELEQDPQQQQQRQQQQGSCMCHGHCHQQLQRPAECQFKCPMHDDHQRQQQQPAACQCQCRSEPHAEQQLQQQQQQQQAGCTAKCTQQQQHPHPGQPEQHSSHRPFHEAWTTSGRGADAAQLLRKLRWACLGPRFDWTARVYDGNAEHRPLPPVLRAIALEAAAAAAAAVAGDSCPTAATRATAAPPVKSHNPDAAIINYYYMGDTLGGHQDNVEKDGTQPIISISLGCDAVFLMGGPIKEVRPTALLLRSGDVLVMGGGSRGCYHGVPRVLTERGLPAELLAAAAAAAAGAARAGHARDAGAADAGSTRDAAGPGPAAEVAGMAGDAAGVAGAAQAPDRAPAPNGVGPAAAAAAARVACSGQEVWAWDAAHVLHMREGRINISIRSTGWDE